MPISKLTGSTDSITVETLRSIVRNRYVWIAPSARLADMQTAVQFGRLASTYTSEQKVTLVITARAVG